jgi:hypothetical protein
VPVKIDENVWLGGMCCKVGAVYNCIPQTSYNVDNVLGLQ